MKCIWWNYGWKVPIPEKENRYLCTGSTESSKQDEHRLTPKHIIKMAKFEEKEIILKAAREKQRVTYKGTPKRLSADFSAGTLHTRRE